MKDILHILEKVVFKSSSRPLLITIAEVILDGEALATHCVNKLRGTFKSKAVLQRPPGLCDRKKCCRDIAVLNCMNKVISEEQGYKLGKNADLTYLEKWELQ